MVWDVWWWWLVDLKAVTAAIRIHHSTCAMAKDTVKLISAEGFEFIVDYQAACVSNTIKNMLSSSGMEAEAA